MKSPIVTAVMLVNQRSKMVAAAIRSFHAQTYEHKRLLIYDSGEEPVIFDAMWSDPEIITVRGEHDPFKPIGTLRNEANSLIGLVAREDRINLIAHFDSDDVSHPRRLEEQVDLWQNVDEEVVGYNQMLFWNEMTANIEVHPEISHASGVLGIVKSIGEAWLYTNHSRVYCVGTSLLYSLDAWRDHPFPDEPKVNVRGRKTGSGEDTIWLQGVKSFAQSSVQDAPLWTIEPRLVARIHGANSQYYAGIESADSNWRRVPTWDDYARKAMAL